MDVNGNVLATTYYVVYVWQRGTENGIGATDATILDGKMDSMERINGMKHSIEQKNPSVGSIILLNWKELDRKWVRP